MFTYKKKIERQLCFWDHIWLERETKGRGRTNKSLNKKTTKLSANKK